MLIKNDAQLGSTISLGRLLGHLMQESQLRSGDAATCGTEADKCLSGHSLLA